ncbi:hypothetical protein V492_06248 [Pseudogymnoascus sp. VKM F-4246]|nr:hypothetical protein V492_06248 [Pseudogymnoascus sp. VKM F-4246]
MTPNQLHLCILGGVHLTRRAAPCGPNDAATTASYHTDDKRVDTGAGTTVWRSNTEPISALLGLQTCWTAVAGWQFTSSRGSRPHHLMHVRSDRVGLLHHLEPTEADEAQDQQRTADDQPLLFRCSTPSYDSFLNQIF